MSYMGIGDVASSSFNTTKYPGIAKPGDVATMATFKNLQAQLNRVAQGLTLSKVSVDGDIGPGTKSLLDQVKSLFAAGGVSVDPARNILMQADTSSVAAIAGQADTLGNAAQAVADQMSVPTKISQPAPIAGTGTIVLPSGTEQRVSVPTPAAASLLDGLGGLSSTELLVAAGAVGAIVYFTGKGGKRKTARVTRRYR